MSEPKHHDKESESKAASDHHSHAKKGSHSKSFVDDMTNLTKAISSGDGLLDAYVKLVQDTFAEGSKKAPAAVSPEDRKAALAECEEAMAGCHKAIAEHKDKFGVAPMGKLGDGHLLQLITQLLGIIGPFLKSVQSAEAA